MEYHLSPGKVLFPKMSTHYTLSRDENGRPKARIIKTPNTVPLGFEPDRWYDIRKERIDLP